MPVIRFVAPYKIPEAHRKILRQYLERPLSMSMPLDSIGLVWGDAVELKFGPTESLLFLEFAESAAKRRAALAEMREENTG